MSPITQQRKMPTPTPTKKAIVIAIIVGKYTNSPSTIISFQAQVLTP